MLTIYLMKKFASRKPMETQPERNIERPPEQTSPTVAQYVEDDDDDDDLKKQGGFTKTLRAMIKEEWPNNTKPVQDLEVLNPGYIASIKRKKRV